MNDIPEFIVVGSGPTGAMAAQTLVERGASVTLLDVGVTDTRYDPLIPDTDFTTLRATDPDQHRYLLGDDFEGIPSPGVMTGAQLTPSRRFVTELVEQLLPLESGSFHPLESLAYGGLGSAWGVGCCVFSKAELSEAGLDPGRMAQAYQTVADRIGISGAADDTQAYTWNGLTGVMPAVDLDETCAYLYGRYQKRRTKLTAQGISMGRTALALLTKDRDERCAFAYRDMDFYSDRDGSAYRPWMTVDRLRTTPRFRYVPGVLVLRFREVDGAVEVQSLDVATRQQVVFRARRLILAAGTLGTGRIVLRSLGSPGDQLPLLCNPYSYVPLIQPSMLRKPMSPRKTGFAQLALFHDPDGTNSDVAMSSIYSYRSLMLFRLLPQAPIDFVDARILMRFLLPAITIAGIHHPERTGPGRFMTLESSTDSPTGDRLRAEYPQTDDELRRIAARERLITGALRTMGAYAIKRINPGIGSSIHYAGTLPFSNEDRPLSLARDGRLHGTAAVSVADGSGFTFLPAKGLTLSLMANAHLVADAAVKRA